MKKRIAAALVCLLSFGFSSPVLSWPIPDTGQTKCFDDVGVEIACDGTGQDGEYTINPPSYTKLDANGNDLPDSATDWAMVRDNVTGLVWEVKQDKDGVENYANPHDADNVYTWYDPDPETNGGNEGTSGNGTDTEDFIDAINAAGFGGHSDWRMPTRAELKSILNYGLNGPAMDRAYFPNTAFLSSSGFFFGFATSEYWSSETCANDSWYAWYVMVDDGSEGGCIGFDGNMGKAGAYHTRAVRGGSTKIKGGFLRNSDGSITDTRYGLMWKASSETQEIWKDAIPLCENSVTGGYTDWRMPTVKEFSSILDSGYFNPAVDLMIFPDNMSGNYHTSTSSTGMESFAWYAGVYFGEVDSSVRSLFNKQNLAAYHRAVRGGQNQIPGHLIIQEPKQGSFWHIDSTLPITWDTAGITGDVAISISYDGGRPGSFEAIVSATPNDGSYQWRIPETLSFNCMLKIEPLSDPSKGTTQGLFSIIRTLNADPGYVVLEEPAASRAPKTSTTFRLTLGSPPASPVGFSIASSNPGEFTVSPATATLDAANWNTGVVITMTSVYDGIADGDQYSAVLVSTTDPFGAFQAKDLRVCDVMVRDANTAATLHSVDPAYGIAGQPMTVTLKGTAFDTATTVSIYPAGGTPVAVTPVTVISTTALSVTIPPQTAGDYHLQTDTSELKNAVTFTDAGTFAGQSRKKAIIAAGGSSTLENNLWLATEKCARGAFVTLTFQGYGTSNIQFLSPKGWIDVNGDGGNDVDAGASSADLQAAVNAAASGGIDELLLYLTGPGGNGVFQFGPDAAPDDLGASTLDTWLDGLQQSTGCKVIVVYDACMSGSFLSSLAAPAGKTRMVMTGASERQRANFLDDGEQSFSHRLFDHLFRTGDLNTAFTKAKQDVRNLQTALMDTTGDGVPDVRKSRESASLTIGRGRSEETDPPAIGAVTADPEDLYAGQYVSEIRAADVTADNGLSQVWCRIVPPLEPFGDPNTPILVLPTLKLLDLDGDRAYENSWEPFDRKGLYRAITYAVDKKGYQSLPEAAKVTQYDGPEPFVDPPLVTTIERTVPNPVTGPELVFHVAFNRAVFGVDPGDFRIDQTTTGAAVLRIEGGGADYRVTVGGFTGDGTIALRVADDNSILDEESTPLGGVLPEDGDFDTGEVYEIGSTASVERGDVNEDGTVDLRDAVLVLRCICGVDADPSILGDADDDGKIGMEDLIYILRQVGGG